MKLEKVIAYLPNWLKRKLLSVSAQNNISISALVTNAVVSVYCPEMRGAIPKGRNRRSGNLSKQQKRNVKAWKRFLLAQGKGPKEAHELALDYKNIKFELTIP